MSEPMKITLGGAEYDIPVLATRQNRIVVPAIFSLAGAEPEARYETLLTITYAALTRAKPDLTQEQFDDLPMPMSDLLAAFPVIQEQAGMRKPGAAVAGANAPKTAEE